MRTELRMKCSNCGYWNRIAVKKVLFEPDSPEPKVKVFIPTYIPLKTETCQKCKTVLAEPKELIRVMKKRSKP